MLSVPLVIKRTESKPDKYRVYLDFKEWGKLILCSGFDLDKTNRLIKEFLSKH